MNFQSQSLAIFEVLAHFKASFWFEIILKIIWNYYSISTNKWLWCFTRFKLNERFFDFLWIFKKLGIVSVSRWLSETFLKLNFGSKISGKIIEIIRIDSQLFDVDVVQVSSSMNTRRIFYKFPKLCRLLAVDFENSAIFEASFRW